MKNPNHYGTVVKLSGNRRRPYQVRSGVTSYSPKGNPNFKIIGYTSSREEANITLALYNKYNNSNYYSQFTLKDLFNLWCNKKMPQLNRSSKESLNAAWHYLSKYENYVYKDIKSFLMQTTID